MAGVRVSQRQAVWEAVKQQRVGLASAVAAAVVLVGVFRAPAIAVLAGCGGALTLLLARSYARARKGGS